jgi:aminoglycoside phosphotransferase (APT) family kinase protein
MRADGRLTEARALLPAILGDDAGAHTIADERITSTGMAVVTTAHASGGPRLVIKIPMTDEAAAGLRRESEVLRSLHADERLGDWRDLLPRSRAEGRAARRTYRVDAALPGRAPTAPSGGAPRRAMLAAAAEAIHTLHQRTATTTAGDRELAERWVDDPLDALWPKRRGRDGPPKRIEPLRAELHGAVLGGRFDTSWVHGDFWPGNLLLGRDGAGIRGIVDWDAAAFPSLALHDLLHLVLYTRRMTTGQELGALIRGHLRGEVWTEEERGLLERYAGWGGLSERHALLLYWLRQVAAHARQQSRRGGPRYRLWERRNVHAVLAEL